MKLIACRNIFGFRKKCVAKTLLIMKLFAFCMLVTFLSASAEGFSQKITINQKDVSLEKLFKEITKQSGYSFIYTENLMRKAKKVSIKKTDVSLDEVLKTCLREQGLTYSIVDNYIIIKEEEKNEKNIEKEEILNATPPDADVTGKVTNEKGEPLQGVSVLIKGTRLGTSTDTKGEFVIKEAPETSTLVFSFVGMETKEVIANGQTSFNIKLTQSTTGLLDDVVISVGYGTQKKTDVISSISSVSPEAITKIPSNDIGEMLRGKAAGVQVTLGSAAPGGSSNILIRGQRSITGGNGPLVIVDGVPVGDINSVNPADVASIDILKDAAAQAIYGARASNGVILITTKSGVTGKPQVTYSGFYGVQKIKPNFDLFTPQEYIQLKREANRTVNGGVYPPDNQIFGPIELESIASGTFINWRDEVLQSAPMQNHTLSLATGTENTKIYTSANYRDQGGIIPNTDFKEANFRFNLNQTVNKWLKVGVNSSAQISTTNDPNVSSILARLVIASPLGKIYNDDGSYRLYPNGFQDLTNPLLDIYETSQKTEARNDLIKLFLDISPFKGFNYRFNISRRSFNENRDIYRTALSAAGVARGGRGQGNVRFRKSNEWLLENVFTYGLKKAKSNLDFTFVQSAIENNFKGFELGINNTANDILGIYGLNTADSYNPSLSTNKRALLSFVGRIEYNYARKYYLTASARSDGSSVFGADNKWGFFPAVSFGWNIYKEYFMPSGNLISNLKLRTSYGSVGNEGIQPYGSLSTAQQRDYIFGDLVSTGYTPSNTLPNPALKWETSTTFNVGLDFGFWKNRLSGSVEYYDTRTKNLLINRSLNAGLGYNDIKDNIGEIQNKGIEFQTNWLAIDKKDLKINLGIIFSKNQNRILDLYGNGADDIANRWFIGHPINVYYTQLYDRIWQEKDDIANSYMPSAKPGDVKVKDKNNDGKLNAEDQYIISQDPSWRGTFTISVGFKGIDLSMDIMTVQGVTRENQYLNAYKYGGTLRGDRNQIAMDYWTPENPGGYYPRPREGNDPPNILTMGYQDASYTRLTNITLGYVLPNSITSKSKLNNVRLYLSARNLITITDFLSYSPEKDPGSYPEAQVIVGGLQINF